MKIYQIENKRNFMDLLILADEQEEMIDKYIDIGIMFVLDDSGVKAEILVTDNGNGVLEIKNLSVFPKYQKMGYGKKLINFVCKHYKNKFNTIYVGTGDSPLTIPFYEKCGFVKSHTVKNFFIDNYDHPIIECGVKLTDMVYLKREL